VSATVIVLAAASAGRAPAWWRWPLEVAAAAVMPWRAAARIRSLSRCLDVTMEAVVVQHDRLHPGERGQAAAPVLRLVRRER